MATAPTGVSRLQALEAILLNPELYWLAEEIPFPDPERGGRMRAYPNFAYLLYEALISVYRSARQVEAELSHEVVWRFAQRMVRRMFPDDRAMRLPGKPMRRHHYLYVRNRYLTDPVVLKRIAALHRETSCKQARELDLLDPSGPGSFTHPHLSRMFYQDGHGFKFPRYRIPADGYVKVHTGSGQDGRGDLFWGLGNFVWNNDGDAAALRYQAKTRDQCSYAGGDSPNPPKAC